MAVLSVCLLFLALSAAEEPTSAMIQEEAETDLSIHLENIDQSEGEEVFEDSMAAKEPEISDNIGTGAANQDKLDAITPNPDEPLILPEGTPVPIKNKDSELSVEIEDHSALNEELELSLNIENEPASIEKTGIDVDIEGESTVFVVSVLPSDIEDIAAAIEGLEPTESAIEAEDPDAVLDSIFTGEDIKKTQTPDEEILTAFLLEEVEPSQVSHRSISSDDFSSSASISQLVLEKTSNGYKAVKDMALVLTINNFSDKAIRAKAALKFEPGVADLYDSLGFTVPLQSEEIVLEPGVEQNMSWTFVCGQAISSGVSSAFPTEMNLAFRVDLICEWDHML